MSVRRGDHVKKILLTPKLNGSQKFEITGRVGIREDSRIRRSLNTRSTKNLQFLFCKETSTSKVLSWFYQCCRAFSVPLVECSGKCRYPKVDKVKNLHKLETIRNQSDCQNKIEAIEASERVLRKLPASNQFPFHFAATGATRECRSQESETMTASTIISRPNVARKIRNSSWSSTPKLRKS